MPSSGKTTVAEGLGRRLRLPLIAKDEINESLYDSLGAGDVESSDLLGGAAYGLIFALARTLLGSGVSLIVEANFFRGQEPEFTALPEHRLVQIHCRAPLATLVARYADRSRHRTPRCREDQGTSGPVRERPARRAETSRRPHGARHDSRSGPRRACRARIVDRLKIEIRPASDETQELMASWRYPPPYDFYDGDADPVLNPERYFEARDEAGELIGFYYFEPKPPDLDYGLGLRPDLTGRGLGLEFFRAGVVFARERYRPRQVFLHVAAFNERAKRVYERAGFRAVSSHMRTFERFGDVEFLTMVESGDALAAPEFGVRFRPWTGRNP